MCYGPNLVKRPIINGYSYVGHFIILMATGEGMLSMGPIYLVSLQKNEIEKIYSYCSWLDCFDM